MGSSAEKTVIRARYTPEPVRIVSWPLRDEALRSAFWAAALGALAALCGGVSGSAALGFAALAALALCAWRLWIPVTFDITSRGVIQSILGRPRRIPWPQIARYRVYARGVLLLADVQQSPLTPLRGLYIPWRGQREALLSALRFYLDARSTTQGSTRSKLNGPPDAKNV